MNNAKVVLESNTHNEFKRIGNQKSKNSFIEDDSSIVNVLSKDSFNEKSDEIKDKFYKKESHYSYVLTKDQLNNFRTVLCNDHLNSNCMDPETCFNSHCTAWQRRNPTKYKYSSLICPDIDFSRKGAKGRMSLNCRCRKGKYCEFAHTKEEELYHPDNYKTRKCNAFPKCKRFYCPFIHNENNLKENIENNIVPITSKNEKNENRMMEIFNQSSQYKSKRVGEVNNGELKQELLMKLVDCQKLVLEEKYLSAQDIAEDFTSMIKSLCKNYFLPEIISAGSKSNVAGSNDGVLYPEKINDNFDNNHVKDVFHFSFDFKKFLKDDLKRNYSLGDLLIQ